MKTIGLLVAVEIGAVLARYGEPKETRCVDGFELLRYENEDYTLVAVNAGAGELAAAAATQLLISVCHADLIVNFGLVGALTPEMKVTHCCVVESVVHYDFDVSGWQPEIEPGRYAQYPTPRIPTTPALVERACAIEPTLRRVVCASADKFVDSEAAKAALHERWGAEICEMEAAGIVLTCHRAGVPCLLIKAVSDGLGGGAEEFLREFDRTAGICLAVADKIIREL